MDSYTSQPSGYKPFAAPCPGCGPGYMAGQRAMQPSRPTLPPRPDLLSQTPTGIPMGPDFGLGQMIQQGAMPQQRVMQQPGTQIVPAGMVPAQQDLAPIVPWNEPIPVTTESLQYMNGFMRTQIGRKVTVEFLIGTNTLTDKTGTLLAVGANYILINEIETDDILLCDFYSIKFMKFYY